MYKLYTPATITSTGICDFLPLSDIIYIHNPAAGDY